MGWCGGCCLAQAVLERFALAFSAGNPHKSQYSKVPSMGPLNLGPYPLLSCLCVAQK